MVNDLMRSLSQTCMCISCFPFAVGKLCAGLCRVGRGEIGSSWVGNRCCRKDL